VSFDQKILVIRFSSIGDIVLSTSPLKTIRRAYPDAQITFLTLDTFAPLLEYHPDIDALVSISKRMSLNNSGGLLIIYAGNNTGIFLISIIPSVQTW